MTPFQSHWTTLPLLLAVASHAAAAPTGQLVYLKKSTVYVAPAAGGPARRLSSSGPVWSVSASPTSGTVLYFTTSQGEPWDQPTDTHGFLSRRPYRSVESLPPPLHHLFAPRTLWTGDGRAALITAAYVQGAYEPASNRFRSARFGDFGACRVSHDGSVVAYRTEREIKVRWPATGRERTLFAVGRPQPLFTALRRARHPHRLRALLHVDPALWRSSRNWRFGNPFLTPDGQTLFFAANLGSGVAMPDSGTGGGIQEDTRFCFFAADVRTGKLSVLSRLGTFYGRIAGEGQVSPDGQRLLFMIHEQVSYRQRWRFAHVVDLRSQRQRELLHADAEYRERMNVTDGACWSPDGRYIAVATRYYDEETAFGPEEKWLSPDDFVLLILDARTGRTVRRIPGARQPSWTR